MAKIKVDKPKTAAPAIVTREINTNPTAPQNIGIGGMKIKTGKVVKDVSEFGYAIAIGDSAPFPGHVHKMLIEKGYITE